MIESKDYIKLVTWSDEDQCYVGTCPGLFSGGVHGDNEAKVYQELCQVVDGWIADYKANGESLPEPTEKKQYTGKFLLRIDPELHKQLDLKAQAHNTSLNKVCENILSGRV